MTLNTGDQIVKLLIQVIMVQVLRVLTSIKSYSEPDSELEVCRFVFSLELMFKVV